MTAISLERIDSVPLQGTEFTFEMQRWLATLVDNLNTTIGLLESTLNQFVLVNGLVMPQYTAAQISALAVDAVNGTLWYNTTTNQVDAFSNSTVKIVV